MSDAELAEKQLKKLRRRLEEFLRHTTPDILLKIAESCGISIPQNLKNRYGSEERKLPIE